ncbi:MAG TPA: hypothetical protein VGK19_05080 [Capsulimonadaceae bacterium]|jgi:hypothetical protein
MTFLSRAQRLALATVVTLVLFAIAGHSTASAQTYNVSVALAGPPVSTEVFAFYLVHNDALNSPSAVSMSNFAYGGGVGGVAPFIALHTTGNLTSGVNFAVDNANPLSAYEPGGSVTAPGFISFQIDASQLSTPNAGSTSDEFGLILLDLPTNQTIITTAPPELINGTGPYTPVFTFRRDSSGAVQTGSYTYESGGQTWSTTITPAIAAAPELATSVSFGFLITLFGMTIIAAKRKGDTNSACNDIA